MTDTDEALGQDVREEATDELMGVEGHELLFAVVAVVEILEGDSVFGHAQDAVVGDGNTEDIATEILDQFLRTIEGSLNVDFPILRQGVLEHVGNVECAMVGIEFAICPELREFKTEAIAELVGK